MAFARIATTTTTYDNEGSGLDVPRKTATSGATSWGGVIDTAQTKPAGLLMRARSDTNLVAKLPVHCSSHMPIPW